MNAGRVVVVGSANVDVRLQVDTIPSPGETLIARDMSRTTGGKGANQAIAAARDGAAVTFIAALGNDSDGALLRDALSREDIDLSRVRQVNAPTGLAVVSVAADGENAIVVVPGANHAIGELDGDDVARIAAADVVLLQLEIPLATVTAAASVTRGTVVLNAAPAAPLPEELLDRVDVLVVNESEAAGLGKSAARVPVVVTTLGGRGAAIRGAQIDDLAVAAPRVTAVDTTGAGDTFCGVLAAGLARGLAWPELLRRAVVAGSLATTRPGAQAAMPHHADIDAAVSQTRVQQNPSAGVSLM